MDGTQDTDVRFAIGWEGSGGVLLAGVAEKADFVVGAAFCSVAVADLGFEPGDEFELAEFGFVSSGCASDFEYTLLFTEVSRISKTNERKSFDRRAI